MLDDLKQRTDPVDATELIELLIKSRNLPKSAKDKIVKDMEKAFYEAGNISLLRAFEEKILTEKEWLEIKDKYGLTIEDMGTILGAYFAGQKKKEDVVAVTHPNTTIHKNKDFIYKRFKVRIMTPTEALDQLKKDNVTDVVTNYKG